MITKMLTIDELQSRNMVNITANFVHNTITATGRCSQCSGGHW